MPTESCGCDPTWTNGHATGWFCSYHAVKRFKGELEKSWRPGPHLEGGRLDQTQPWVAPIGIKDSGERVTYASGSMRDPSTGKIKWSRITFGPMMRRWAQHLTNAEAKYPDPKPGVPNFTLIETEEEYHRYRESAFRHFMSWWDGDTSEDHASATFFNINGCELILEKRKAREKV